MSDEGKPVQADHLIKKSAWRGIVAIGESMERSTTWSVAGTAAIAGLIISQLASVSDDSTRQNPAIATTCDRIDSDWRYP
jgi:hypothetical protein